MLIPKLLPIPFAENGRKNTIPDNRTSEMQAHLASFDTGFPAITMLPKQDGGLPPDGMDMNGILYDLSVHAVYQNKGGQYKFDAEYAELIGGYPKGAILLSDDEAKQYISVVESNKDNFNTSTSANWKVITLADIDVLLNDKVSSQNVSEALNLKADKDRQIIAGNGLSGGGTLAANRTINLGTPTKITSSSTNIVTTTSHTHAIDSASLTVAGVVQLNNTVTSTSTTQAATANAVKMAYDRATNAMTTVVQTTGTSTTSVMSQKAATDAINAKITGGSVVQTTGESTTSVMSQKATTEQIFKGNFRNVTSERVKNVLYTNNTGKVLDLYIEYRAHGDQKIYFQLNGVNMLASEIIQTGASLILGFYIQVMPRDTYKFYSSYAAQTYLTIYNWWER